MREELAEALLGKIMGWSKEDLSKERFQNQMLAELKYDNYQQYMLGMKYIESLALWLNKFEDDDRLVLYDFIKKNLVYISEVQMRQLIDMSYDYYVKPILINNTKRICNEHRIMDIAKREDVYKCLRRQSLFLGLSDGSHIDVFRRDHPFLNNEQINIYYDFSKEKVKDLNEDLKTDLVKYEKLLIPKDGFKYIFLLDDFTASGISFIRKDENKWKGKVAKFLKQLQEYDLKCDEIDVYIIIFIATKEAIDYINKQLELFKNDNSISTELRAIAIQYVNKLVLDDELKGIFEKYYQRYQMCEIEDVHYHKGKHCLPFMGFNECGLPLVIYHNAPNNSFPIIWFDKKDIFKGLFPRITRHKGSII